MSSTNVSKSATFELFSLQFVLAALLAFLPGFLSINVAPLIPLMLETYGFDRGQGGLVISAALLTHTLFLLPGGILIDRLGVRRATMLAAGFGLVGSVLIGVAGSLPLLIAGRLIIGLNNGIMFPAPLRLVAARSEGRSASTSQGIVGAFTFVGSVVGTILPPAVVLAVGWTPFFIGVAGFCGLTGVMTAIAVQDDDRPTNPKSSPALFTRSLFDGRVVALGLVHLASYGIYRGFQPWFVDYLVTSFKVPLVTAAGFASLAVVGAVVGRSLGGMIASFAGQGRVIVLSMAATVLSIVTLVFAGSAIAGVVVLVVLGTVANLTFGPIFDLLGKTSGGSHASAIALAIQVANIGALALPVIVGYLVGEGSSFVSSFIALCAVALAVDAYLLLRSPIKSDLIGS